MNATVAAIWPWSLFAGSSTIVVLLGTSLLGVAGGVVGTFMLLRKRSLMGDVVSHASLPGVALAFIALQVMRGGGGKSLPALLVGAALVGLVAMLCVVAIRRYWRIKEDAAMAIVLSVFFGLGVALLRVVQELPGGSSAGLDHFIYGRAALIVESDVWLIAASCLVVLVLCGLLFKEFALLAFDEDFAAAQGWPALLLDIVLMGLVVGVTVVGLQSVGLLLVVAILIIPSAAARFWTDHLPSLTLLAGLIGGLSAAGGVLVSAHSALPAGAIIVLVAGALFAGSFLLGRRRGVARRLLTERRLRRRVGRHDLLRAMYEALEGSGSHRRAVAELSGRAVSFDRLVDARSWTATELTRIVRRAAADGLVAVDGGRNLHLTERGAASAARVVRNHRLWEMYLIRYADVAPSHVDRDADLIEHVLRPELVRELEAALSEPREETAVPQSPHGIPT